MSCPNCGYCPHCGRSGWYFYPQYPQPYWPSQPAIIWSGVNPNLGTVGIAPTQNTSAAPITYTAHCPNALPTFNFASC